MMEWLLTTGQPVPAQGGCFLKLELKLLNTDDFDIFCNLYLCACELGCFYFVEYLKFYDFILHVYLAWFQKLDQFKDSRSN